MTLTDFEKNAIKNQSLRGETQQTGTRRCPADTAGYVAQKMVDGMVSGEAKIFAQDWIMRTNPEDA